VCIGRKGILIKPILGGSTTAPAIAPVVKQEDRQTEVMKLDKVLQPIDDIACIPMAPEKYRRGFGGRHKPPEQLRPIGGLK